MTRYRSVMLATGFAAVAAAAITGMSLSAQTREVNIAETCSHAAWPQIPAGCLEGGKGQEVRFVTANREPITAAMAQRFASAFE